MVNVKAAILALGTLKMITPMYTTLTYLIASCQISQALKATILADTNRDGKVDTTGTSDVDGKLTWTNARGALFLPNIVDTDRRCSTTVTHYMEVHTCHDASDNVLRQPQYLAPLRTLPAIDASSNAFAVINVTEAAAAQNIRIFFKEGSSWTFVEEDHKFTATQLKAGLELGIDGRDVRRPGVWDGKATVNFSIIDGAQTSTDAVQLRVAPYLTHHPEQLAQRSFVSNKNDPHMIKFNADFTEHNNRAGLPQPPTVLRTPDIWTQDFFEPGYASIPGANGPIVIRIMLQSYQRRSNSVSVFTELRNDKVGAIGFPEVWNEPFKGSDTYDSTGNLETIPPYTHNGKSYPAGRVIIGEGSIKPSILPFLQSQEAQDPIVLDTSWLRVGHVDEFIQFLPANNSRGWVVMVEDTIEGLAILKKASAAGHGGTRAVSRPVYSYDPLERGWMPACVPKSSIDFELRRADLERINKYAAERVEHNLDIIKRETGVTDAEIFRVPGIVYNTGPWTCGMSGGARVASKANGGDDAFVESDIITAAGGKRNLLESRQSVETVRAHYPAAINGVVLSDSYYLSPNPWGPVINGVDIFAKAIEDAYAKVNFSVHFIDTWFTHHWGNGEVHCGSNVWRETTGRWW
ncbi:Protein-arginine deiminase type-1 [Paramyrothecium foliicola]|nr:Protein-arginine deiminase type-1 [Paramyrothecium foliicola]